METALSLSLSHKKKQCLNVTGGSFHVRNTARDHVAAKKGRRTLHARRSGARRRAPPVCRCLAWKGEGRVAKRQRHAVGARFQ